MWEIKTVLLSLSLVLLAAASFCIYKGLIEKKPGHQSEIRVQGPCENEYKKYCLNGLSII